MYLQAIHEPSRQNSTQRNTGLQEMVYICTLKKRLCQANPYFFTKTAKTLRGLFQSIYKNQFFLHKENRTAKKIHSKKNA